MTGVLLTVLILGACSGSTGGRSGARPGNLPTLESRTIRFGGLDRMYGYFAPTARPARAPLLVLAHLFVLAPGVQDERGAGDASSLIQLAQERGFSVATPAGVDFSFNGGTCCGTEARQQFDSVGFLGAVIDDAVSRGGVDPRRIYLVGFSNGGFLAYRAACEHPEWFAGVAVVEGGLLVPECSPRRPTDLLVIHQQGDDVVPYAGTERATIPGDPVPLPSVRDSLARYRAGAGCHRPRRRVVDGVRTETSRCRSSRLRLVVLAGGEHSFPVSPPATGGARWIEEFFHLDRLQDQ